MRAWIIDTLYCLIAGAIFWLLVIIMGVRAL